MKLIITDTNWADEMDVYGFEVMSNQRYQVALKIIEKALEVQPEFELYIGTNESLFINKDFARHFTVQDLSEEDGAHVARIFGRAPQGIAIFGTLLDYGLDYLYENDKELYDTLLKELES